MKRFLAILLAMAMLLALAGCKEDNAPATTSVPETTAPGAEQFAQLYRDAVADLEAAGAVTLDVKQSKTMEVGDQLFVTEREQVVAYGGLNTDKEMIRMEENVNYNPDADEDEDAEETKLYSEVYAEGVLYVELEKVSTQRGAVSAEEAAARFVPVALLDASLYGSITMETTDDLQKITFAEPTAAEAWAVPAEAQLLDASGVAELTAEGALSRMEYTVTYLYGNQEITRKVESTPRAEAMEVALPRMHYLFTELTYVQAMYDVILAEELVSLAETAAVSTSYSGLSYAGGVQYGLSERGYAHGTGDDLIAKFEYNVQVYTTQGEDGYEREQTYQNGKLVTVIDEGLPTTQSGVKPDTVKETMDSMLENAVPSPEFWQDVTCSEIGGKYLLEFTYTEDFGTNEQNSVCEFFFEDATILNQLASHYENKATNGYLSMEQYTGLPVASGRYYEGVHTIQKEECILSWQIDTAYELPSYGAYKNITDEYREDAEPENKATPLFYKVTGTDGQQMWLLGTIHIGDARTAYLPQEIYDAVSGSDAIALEVDNDSAEERLENDEKLQNALYAEWYYTDGTIEDHLDEETYALAVRHMKASGNYNSNMNYLKIGIWETMLDLYGIALNHDLHTEQGVEDRLTKLAKEQEIPIWEVEDFVEHNNIVVNWSEELQLLLLESALEEDALAAAASTQELYELWCAGDEAALREMLNEEADLSELTEEEKEEYEAAKPLLEEYEKAMMYDRNELMLKKAQEYLESGDVVFFAVGLAHLLDDTNGLVDGLRAAGYTVELVTYQ